MFIIIFPVILINELILKFYFNNISVIFSKWSEVLVYDWSDGGDSEIIVEDIERINFDQYDDNEHKFTDWYYSREQYWADIRMK